MNRILFESDEIDSHGRVVLRDHRAEHIRSVLKAAPGKELKTGTVNGLCGFSQVLEVSSDSVCLEVRHTNQSIQPWFDLILAMPRPLVLKRLWPQLATLGAGKIILLQAARVEKFYFSSQWIDPVAVRPLLIEGAMQSGSTYLPTFQISRNFKRFMHEELDALFSESSRLLAHPGTTTALSTDNMDARRPLLAVGPEGGWKRDEIDLFVANGFSMFSLGSRVMRSDTACIALIAVMNYIFESRPSLPRC